MLAAGHCPAGFSGAAPAKAIAPGIALQSDNGGSLAALRALERDNCYFRDWLRFARAPHMDGQLASDSRFGAMQGQNFSTIDLAEFAGKTCPSNVPQWDYPRADLLRPRP
jgi:inner membrane protein